MFEVTQRGLYSCCVFAWALVLCQGANANAMVEAMIPMKLDVSERRIDHSPPSAPTLTLLRVHRRTGLIQVNDSTVTSMPYGGSITFRLVGASDDRTPHGKIGYRFHYVDGTLPHRAVVSDIAYLLQSGEHLTFHWDDGRTWDQDAFVFRVTVTAVDRAGNESEPSNVVIVGDDGDTSWAKRQFESLVEREQWRRVQLAERRDRGISKAEMDSITAATYPRGPSSPSAIGDVYDQLTVDVLTNAGSGRIDRVSSYDTRSQEGAPNEPEPDDRKFETGRDLSQSEIFQLQSILLEPRNYITDSYLCEFWPEFTFALQSESTQFLVDLGVRCHIVRIRIDGVDHFGSLTEWTAPMVRAFCNGLLELPLLDEER